MSAGVSDAAAAPAHDYSDYSADPYETITDKMPESVASVSSTGSKREPYTLPELEEDAGEASHFFSCVSVRALDVWLSQTLLNTS